MRIGKLTDYALLIVCQLNTQTVLPASKISEATRVPLATTNKILKLLCKSYICNSKGGKSGGFFLLKNPSQISLLDVIKAIEGQPVSLTQCSNSTGCKLQSHCKIASKMQLIDKEISQVLANRFISDLI